MRRVRVIAWAAPSCWVTSQGMQPVALACRRSGCGDRLLRGRRPSRPAQNNGPLPRQACTRDAGRAGSGRASVMVH